MWILSSRYAMRVVSDVAVFGLGIGIGIGIVRRG